MEAREQLRQENLNKMLDFTTTARRMSLDRRNTAAGLTDVVRERRASVGAANQKEKDRRLSSASSSASTSALLAS